MLENASLFRNQFQIIEGMVSYDRQKVSRGLIDQATTATRKACEDKEMNMERERGTKQSVFYSGSILLFSRLFLVR